MRKAMGFAAGWVAVHLLGQASAQPILHNLAFNPDDTPTYEVIFGAPTPVSSFHGLNNALLFHASAGYDQIRLPINTVASTYQVDFDVVTHGLANTKYTFDVSLDTPSVRNLSMHGAANYFQVFQNDPYGGGSLQPFLDDQIYHVSILADIPKNFWEISIDGKVLYHQLLNANRLASIRFTMSPWFYNSPSDPNAFAAIDNVIVQVPEPTATSLLLVATLLLT